MGIKWEASGRYLGRIWKASQILEGISGGGLLLAGLGVGPGCGTGRPASWAKMIGKT